MFATRPLSLGWAKNAGWRPAVRCCNTGVRRQWFVLDAIQFASPCAHFDARSALRRQRIETARNGHDLRVRQFVQLRERGLAEIEAGDFAAMAAHPGAIAFKHAAISDAVRGVADRAADDAGEAQARIVCKRDLRELGCVFGVADMTAAGVVDRMTALVQFDRILIGGAPSFGDEAASSSAPVSPRTRRPIRPRLRNALARSASLALKSAATVVNMRSASAS